MFTDPVSMYNLFFNITQKFTNVFVQLSIFLIDLFVGTYRLSSHARLEAFVIQSKVNYVQLEHNSCCCSHSSFFKGHLPPRHPHPYPHPHPHVLGIVVISAIPQKCVNPWL